MKMTPKQISRKISQLKSERSVWESHWQQLTDYILPRKNNIQFKTSPGNRRNLHLLDNTAQMANELLAAALHGLLTNPYSQWFDLTCGDPELDAKDSVRYWLQDSARRMLNVINDSNFQTEVHEYYLDLPCIGTATLDMLEDDFSIVRFNARFISDTYIAENNKGLIDEVYREFEWTAKQIAMEFGEDKIPKMVKDALRKDEERKFCIHHAVYPVDPTKKKRGPLSMFNFISQYTMPEEEFELSTKGFYENPYIVGRWSKTSDEVYGRGPGMVALPEAKVLNKMTETIIKAAELTVRPPLQVPDDGFVLPIRTTPAGLNFYRSGSEDRITPIFNEGIRIDYGHEIMQQHRERIRQAFYVDQLLLSNVGPQMTATEVNQRTEERMRLLGPMLGRQQSEFLAPMIERLFKIMSRRNMFLPVPEELSRTKGLSVQYSSVIARMQRVSEGQNIDRTLAALAPFAQFDPSVLDNFDGDKSFREIARIYGLPQTMVRDMRKVTKLRDQRAAAQQEIKRKQDEANAADQAAKVVPAIAQVNKAG